MSVPLTLLADHALYRLEADLRWIDHTAAGVDLLPRPIRRRDGRVGKFTGTRP
jgi:hypothetical protein